ncbi:hypothetical protein QAD02_013719 [Eretmocerus hayati]|uniref:Uncharacterized protein n=1 Tax=Eretmocerus hayati TaxID=131215 RepID=A0ACC2P3H1_9HYME|nr:hypothetical protein QAD02_013719 [Eretmocerus hayati]
MCCGEIVIMTDSLDSEISNQQTTSSANNSESANSNTSSESLYADTISAQQIMVDVEENSSSDPEDMTISESYTLMKQLMKGQNKKLAEQIKHGNDELKDQLMEKMETISKSITVIEEDLEDLQNRVHVLENAHNTGAEEMNEHALYEVESRLIKRNNVIIYNITENDDPDHLGNYLSNMFEGAPFDLASVKFLRLGKAEKDKDKVRPVKLIFNNFEDAKWVLMNQKDFCLEGVKCTSDKTQSQRKYLSSKISELEGRKKAGEAGLSLKYIDGVPTILDSTSSKQNKAQGSTSSNSGGLKHPQASSKQKKKNSNNHRGRGRGKK